MTIVKPGPFHPWGFKEQHRPRAYFSDTVSYWRYWAEKLHLSTAARLRLEWMIFYFTVGEENGSSTASHFGIARQIFIKWKKRFNPKDLRSLEDHSRSPIRKRIWTVTPHEETQIKEVRNAHLKWGKEKLKREYQRLFKEEISTNKIQKVINKYHLYPDPKMQKQRLKKRHANRKKTYIHTFKKRKELGFLWHTDSIVIWWYGQRRVIFTALEEVSKIAYARVYTTNSSKNARDFLERLLYLSNNEVKHIHHDNGSEFYGDFEKACEELSLPQIFSRARTPKDNPCLERFNKTVQEEWLSLSPFGLDEIPLANEDLTTWLLEYNSIRPHEALDYLTPIEYATKTFKVSPMWASGTSS